MCEYCDQLKYVLTKSPVIDCPKCATPLTNTDIPSTCSGYFIYALIHQNAFAQRWNDIQTSLITTRHKHIHPSLNYPQPVEHATLPRDKDRHSKAVLATNTDTIQTRVFSVNLALTTHKLGLIRQVLTSTPASRQCTKTHISNPTMTLTMTHLHKLHGLVHSVQNQTLSHQVLFHHLRITAMSTLTPSDRTLKITFDNTIHTLTPPDTMSVTKPHHLHLYLQLYDNLPYLQHTHDVDEHFTLHLIITTNFTSTVSVF